MSIVVSISLLILTIPALIIMTYDMFVFNKKEYKISYKSKLFLSIMFTFISIGAAIAILEFVMYFIDSESQLVPTYLMWTLTAFTYVLIATVYMIIFFWSQYVIFGISDEGIKIFGESITKEKIECIICDKDTKDIYIVFLEGARKVKKLKVSQKAKYASLILENYSLLDTKLIEDASFEVKFKEIWNEKRGISLNENIVSDPESSK